MTVLLGKFQSHKEITARTALRGASDAAHQRMHGLKPFTQIAAGTMLMSQYCVLLQSLYLFHSAVGDAAHLSGCSDVSSAMRRLELLRSDIAFLGGTEPVPITNWRPGVSEEVLGALYVAEGSMLGGRVIARQLNFLFGAQPEGRSFFFGNKCDNANWTRLLLLLEDRCADPRALNAAINGAHRAFDWFELCVTAFDRASESIRRN